MGFVNSPATTQRFLFSPGQAAAFPIPTAGVVTKADIATEEQCRQAEELLALAEKILSGEVPPFCPHGRPCVLKLTRKELEKQFGRIV